MAPTLSQKQWALSLTILGLMLGLCLHQFFQITGQKAELTFLDVGQGDAILIQTPEFRNILIDAGPDGGVIRELSRKLSFFNQKIDLFILTHPDLDHYGGALDLLQKYPVKSVMLTGIAGTSDLYLAFLQEIKALKIPILYPESDKDWQLGPNLFLDIIYPLKGQHLLGQNVKNKNDTSVSIILRNAAGDPLALLTGDAEEDEERELLLSGQDLRAEIFKLGHHGSKSSSTVPFLAAVNPQTVVVSAGRDNKFGHPHEEVLARAQRLNILYTWDGPVHFTVGE